MKFAQVVGWVLGGILALIALYAIGSSLLWLFYAIGVALYWAMTIFFALALFVFAFGFMVMLGHWIWPGELDVTYIDYEEGEEPA